MTLVFAGAEGRTVFTSASPAGIFQLQALVCKVSPPSALHALSGFVLQFCWSDEAAADAKTVFDKLVGGVYRSDCEDCVGMGLTDPSALCGLNPSCFADRTRW